ncbi:BamA/TamA family outer membrane protein [Formosa sp. PL04]|uniref:translocation and assembly module lipoprotein TamL n=1 Tax=Formosa sp. PL04 TaxID=3081755 RepID=UPI002980D31D|nr:BamA/TamA family outer membrane protein [Formosa sp. PL04]MDW5289253.1 BamA/TamA family outer membrane protein [Formosa sp. PL04]
MKTHNDITCSKKWCNFIVVILTLALLQACSITKHIPEDNLLYTGAHVKIQSDSILKNKDQLKDELESTIRPVPNSKVLGMYLGLYYYYKMQNKKSNFINKWIYKKIGEEPVYQSTVKTFDVEDILVNRLENHGFFYSSASSEIVKNEEKKEASVDYTIDVKQPYTMVTYQVDSMSGVIFEELKKSLSKTELKPGIRFDLDYLKTERLRIDADLKKAGYYNFNSDFLIFEADTTRYKDRQFDLYVRLKNATPEKSAIPYRVGNINIYPDHDIENDSIKQETTRFNNKNYIQDTIFFKPKYLDSYIKIQEGDYYSPIKSRNTARRLSTIGTYKFVNIQYEERDSINGDTLGILDANIYLSPLNQRAIRAEVQAVTKSNDFAGPALELAYNNRNIFRGGEIFSLSANVGYEFQVGGGSQKGISNTSLGLNSELIFPRVIIPFKIRDDFFKYSIPKTKTSLGINYLNRTDMYTLASGTAEFGYIWKENRFITHEVIPISINYTNLIKTTPEFDQILEENPFLESSFEQQFIAGLTYSFTYNEMVDTKKSHQFYTNVNLDVAGNFISLFGTKNDAGNQTFLGLEYAQYAKADIDLRYHFNFKKEQTIATRVFAGYGLPFGNSEIMPYIKQYSAGGPNSIRAFRIRSLGPGTYKGSEDSEGEDNYIDQTGNISLEANVEYRFPLFSYFKGALFVDAGNVWNSIENEAQPGGKFTSEFMRQLGIGVGVGLRVDVQGFVIRFDFATPISDPAFDKGERIDFQYKETTFNFAIGYPF